ncbi:MAG: hypothetical protein US13_C0004G0102 [candidate division TM6 bacterium GW2011_GWE2_36_25]|nr:MAG: hypothetical protein US03_C0004G0102 [candidate division TM6 bacterium GW2011_GWF2_36_131]KKQ03280.1 MAG: hypothetical protein US13_C0004G0102 [candidate division TM6 bacterium GW2011_GWE2_36_25]KKQ19202.1 MAG: hypothetical protein US32_C0014G0023 [candidate division TM6 bacterium GW2011_GWA2_36_9]
MNLRRIMTKGLFFFFCFAHFICAKTNMEDFSRAEALKQLLKLKTETPGLFLYLTAPQKEDLWVFHDSKRTINNERIFDNKRALVPHAKELLKQGFMYLDHSEIKVRPIFKELITDLENELQTS